MKTHTRKAWYGNFDDKQGPYYSWNMLNDEDTITKRKQYWVDFVLWADDNLGQGYSLACEDGSLLDPITNWAFKSYISGRDHK